VDEDETRAEDPAAGSTGDGRGGFVRDRTHRFPGRRNALKVLYDDVEVASVRSAALMAGLTATGYVAAAALSSAGAGPAPSSSADRAMLAELLQARTALGRFGVNVNQAVAALNSGAGAPVWLLAAVSGCLRSSERIDDVTIELARRLR
jgi:hypothetical protein